MKNKINRLSRGLTDEPRPLPVVSPDYIEENVTPDSVCRAGFRITNKNDIPLKGVAYVSDPRVRLVKWQFAGQESILALEFKSDGLKEGEQVTGSCTIVTNAGEINLPYCFVIVSENTSRNDIRIETIQDFAQFCRENSELAVRLFDSDQMLTQPFMEDEKLTAIYKVLAAGQDKANSLEEFLVAAGAKKEVRITSVDKEMRIALNSKIEEGALRLQTNSWGLAEVRLECDSNVIALDTKSLSPNDFVGGSADVGFVIDDRYLHAGLNYARITVSWGLHSFSIPVTITSSSYHEGLHLLGTSERRERTAASIVFLNWVDHGMPVNEARPVKIALEKLSIAHPDDIEIRLFLSAVMAYMGLKDDASAICSEVKSTVLASRSQNAPLYCLFVYVRYLITGNESQRETLSKVLKKFYEDGDISLLVCLLRLLVDPEIAGIPAITFTSARAYYNDGVHSPWLYSIAARALEKDNSVFKMAGKFELKTLYYGSRHGMLGKKTALLVASFADQEKSCKKIYLDTLMNLYAAYRQKEVLSAICSLLIKGDRKSVEYHKWYKAGVEEELKLTRLYEYYLESLSRTGSEKIPEMVLMYFSFDHLLAADTRAFLYAYILKHFDPDTELRQMYQKQIEEYSIEQLLNGRIDENLAVIYHNTLVADMIDEKLARIMPDILTANRVTCASSNITRVYAANSTLKDAVNAPFRKDGAILSVYLPASTSYIVEDRSGRRSMDADITVTPLLSETALMKRCKKLNTSHPGIVAICSEELLRKDKFTTQDFDSLELYSRSKFISEALKKRLERRAVEYYMDHSKDEGAEVMLSKLSLESMDEKDKAFLFSMYVEKGYYDKAEEILKSANVRDLDKVALETLVLKQLFASDYEYNESTLRLVDYLHSEGSDDNEILKYLDRFYNGSNEDMQTLCTQLEDFHLVSKDFYERYLGQLLFSEAGVKMVDSVYRKYASVYNADPVLTNAWYYTCLTDAFVNKKLPAEDILKVLKYKIGDPEAIPMLPVIDLLVGAVMLNAQEALTNEDIHRAYEILKTLLEKEICFHFMQELSIRCRFKIPELSKTLVICKSEGRDRHLQIRFRILPDMEEPAAEEIKPMVYGYYMQSYALFANEKLEYEIVDLTDGHANVIQKETRKGLAAESVCNDRFSMLNEMFKADTKKSYDKLQDQMLDYSDIDHTVNSLFTIRH